MLDLPHADGANEARAAGGHGRGLRAPARSDERHGRRIAWPPTACPARSAIRSAPSGSARPRASPAASSSNAAPDSSGARCSARSEIDAGRTRADALGARATPDRSARTSGSRSSARRATRSTRKALGPERAEHRDAARAGALPRMAAQRVSQPSGAASPVTCRRSPSPTPIASVLGEPRAGLGRHTFRGGNFFMLRMLNRYRTSSASRPCRGARRRGPRRRIRHLQTETATVAMRRRASQRRVARLDVSRAQPDRAQAADRLSLAPGLAAPHRPRRAGRTVFESGAVDRVGRDRRQRQRRRSACGFEPHYDEIRSADEVQIYESIMADAAGRSRPDCCRATRSSRTTACCRAASTRDGRAGHRGARGRGQDDDFGAEATASATWSMSPRRRDRSGSRRSCGISRSRFDGRGTCALRRGRTEAVRLVFDAMSAQSSIVVGTASLQVQ